MHRFLIVSVVSCFALPALAADNASCKLSADKKSVSIVATNPYAQVMRCEVHCDIGLAGGFSSAVCAKDVPVGAKDFVMCTETAGQGHSYTAITGSEITCPDPTAAAAPAAKDKDTADSDGDSDSDEDSDAPIKRVQKQSVDRMNQLQQQNK